VPPNISDWQWGDEEGMRVRNFGTGVVGLTAVVCACAVPAQGVKRVETRPVFVFSGAGYYHRFAQADMHEYTPKGQGDLKRFTDMVTSRVYASVTTEEGLAETANTVLDQYKAAKGVVVRTNSVPKTAARPAEHFIAVVFGRPEFIEIAFARFRMQDGRGMSMVYSKRVYGSRVGDAASKWLKERGEAVERALMSVERIPTAVK
jgi:hypothetical protein